jgi:PKD repeat protein
MYLYVYHSSMKNKKTHLKILLPFLLFLLGFVFTATSQIRPDAIANLKLWLRADSAVTYDGSNKVSQWNDCSGQGNNASQVASASQPQYISNVLNGYPVIHFDGVDDFMKTAAFTLNQPENIFIVYKPVTWNGANKAIFDGYNTESMALENYPTSPSISLYNGASYVASNNNATVGSFHVVECLYSGSNSYIKVDNTTPTTANGGTTSGGGFELGGLAGYTTYCSNVDIAEVLIYDRNLTINERLQVETYLANKYAGPSVNLGPDITIPYGFCDTTLIAGGSFTSYLWSTGETTQTKNVDTSGSYSVTATDIFGFTSSDTVTVTYPQINLHDTLFCSGSNVLLSTGLSGSYTFLWSDGQSTPTDTVIIPGTYYVTVTDDSSCTAISNIISVTEDDFPHTAGLGNNDSLCVGNLIGLVAPVPLPPISSYNWSTLETTSTIAVGYPGGDYSLTVTDANGCIARDTINIYISGTAPTVNFTYSHGCTGDPVSFTNSSSIPGDSVLWDFGDGQTSTLQNPSHIFTTANNHNVMLSVFSGTCSNFLIKQIHVPQSPVAAFNPGNACKNHAYPFFDQSTAALGDSIISWDWDFGDGSPHSNLQNASHAYLSASIFNVVLTVQTDSGCQNSISHPITVVVSAPEPSGFTLYLPSNSMVTTNHTIDFAWNIAVGASTYTLEYSSDPNFISNVIAIPNIVSTTYHTTIGISQTYYWKVIAYGLCGDSVLSNTFSFTIMSQNTISGLTVWLRSDSAITYDGSNKVSQWNDCSGQGNNASQVASGAKPQYVSNTLNGYPVIQFDGVDDFIKTAAFTLNQPENVFIVYKPNTWVNNSYFFDGNTIDNMGLILFSIAPKIYLYAGNLAVSNSNATIGIYHIGEFLFNGPSSSITVDASIATHGNAGSNNAGGFTLGGDGSGMHNSSSAVAEVLIYNQALSIMDRQIVENYLHYKYCGPPVNLGPDIWANNFCDTTLDAGIRFTNYHWSTGETTHNIIVNSGGTYSVTVTDVFGFNSVDTVIVHKPIIAAHDTIACYGNPVTLHTGLGAPFTFQWNGSSTADSLVAAVPSTNTLIVHDPSGCSATRVINVVADSFPIKASLGPPNINVCTGEEIGLVSGLEAGLSYDWFDGTSHTHDSTYTINWTASSHTITLTVSNSRGCVATDQITVSVQGQLPVPGFTASANCYPALTTFTDISTVAGTGAIITGWNWDFGNGGTSIVQHPSYYFSTPGIHLITLTVSSNKGCSKSITDTAFVYSVPAPHFGPIIGCSGVPLEFHDMSTNLLGDITIHNWDFGDSNTATGDTVIHTYGSAGTDTVRLYVESEYGCNNSISIAVNIRATPDVGFLYSSVCDGNPVYFTDTSHVPNVSADIINWLWDFGTGNTSTFQNPVYTFDNAGTYPVILSVKSINGCITRDTQNVVVHALPDAGFSSEDICMGSPHQFNDTSTVLSPDAINAWKWNFGSAGTAGQQNPAISFATAGTYQISLEVTSNAGCKDSVSHTVEVLPSPIAAFVPDEYYGEANFTVNFTNNSTGLNNTYLWNFGDTLGSSTLLNPSYTYTENGIYNVSLIAYNQYGCNDTAHQEITVMHTRADIAVSAVNVVVKDNYVSLSALLTNMGSRKLYALDILAKAAGGTTFKESWADPTDPLTPGDTMTFNFTAQYQLTEDQITEYICIESQIQGIYPDDDPSNNEQCATLSKKFTVFQPYPSPAHDAVNLDFILPFADDIVIDLFGVRGELIKNVFDGQAEKGLNKLTVELSNLQLGVYTFRVLFKDDVKVLKFVVY